jgi:hypothetical protein
LKKKKERRLYEVEKKREGPLENHSSPGGTTNEDQKAVEVAIKI